jgi:hypothetical protein
MTKKITCSLAVERRAIISRFIVIASLASFGLSQQAAAATLYDNGPISGLISNQFLNTPSVADLNSINNVAESFTLSDASTVTGVTFGSWVYAGALTSVQWYITTAPYGGTVVASGTALPTSTLFSTNRLLKNVS